jgi:hypothetical protein
MTRKQLLRKAADRERAKLNRAAPAVLKYAFSHLSDEEFFQEMNRFKRMAESEVPWEVMEEELMKLADSNPGNFLGAEKQN